MESVDSCWQNLSIHAGSWRLFLNNFQEPSLSPNFFETALLQLFGRGSSSKLCPNVHASLRMRDRVVVLWDVETKRCLESDSGRILLSTVSLCALDSVQLSRSCRNVIFFG